MAAFDPRNGPSFGTDAPAPKARLSRDETRAVGFAVGALGGSIGTAAVLKYAVECARDAGEDRYQAGAPPRPTPRRRWWRRFRASTRR